ncbi:hypothetical protein VE00_06964 [Pseudogymnoascus sp. WSF 3629]|nr:hypothetical protein VE00_06964 [Pseudogymnoascus sp. WSF 3629]
MVSVPQPPAAAQPTQEIKLAAASATNTAMPTTTAGPSGTWSPSSWTTKPIKQDAIYASRPAVERVLANLSRLPPLVNPYEIENLKAKLRDVAQGKAFLLQGGDCAELFDYCQDGAIESKIKLLLQMSLVLISGCNKPVVRIARMAGQYAKPRSSPMEMVDGKEIPSFRGDILNGFDVGERDLDPERLKSAYFHSAATLNFVRASLASGFADLHRPLDWGLGHVQDPELQAKYTKIVDSITGTLRMMRAVGVGAESSAGLQTVDLYTSHEGLLLEYEQSLTRKLPIPSETTSTVPAHETDSSAPTGSKKAYYNTSAHFLWVGDRTRQIDGAHIEYFRGIANPIGVKIGPTTSVTDLMALLRTLNPTCEVGKITLITRYGASKVSELLPAHIRAVESSEYKRCVVWQCDPMHGNTRSTPSGIKTRVFGDIFSELQKTLQVHKEEGSYLGGVHLELTGEAVTECMGGSEGLNEEDLGTNYTSYCDPRLNEKQALEMAFLIAGHYKGQEAL